MSNRSPTRKTAGRGRTTAPKRASSSGSQPKAAPTKGKWSRQVMETSNAMDLEKGVFSKDHPRQIALSLKKSSDHSRRRKSDAFRSAMSMLNFYINRAGRKLPKEKKLRLEAAKQELRDLYGR